MLENLAPCFEKVFTVTPDSPRAMTAEELEEEAKYHMDAEAAPSVAKAIRLAVDYADENNLAGVVVCGSLYLAAQARPLLLAQRPVYWEHTPAAGRFLLLLPKMKEVDNPLGESLFCSGAGNIGGLPDR